MIEPLPVVSRLLDLPPLETAMKSSILILAVLTSLGACPAAHDHEHEHGDGGHHGVACEQHSDCGEAEHCMDGVCHGVGGNGADGGSSPVDTYVAGLSKTGAMGRVVLTLVESDPLPRDLTLYTWTILVTDPAGNPIDGARVTAEPRMPDHGHGTTPLFHDASYSEPDGHYSLDDIDLFMPGYWTFTFEIEYSYKIEVGPGRKSRFL